MWNFLAVRGVEIQTVKALNDLPLIWGWTAPGHFLLFDLRPSSDGGYSLWRRGRAWIEKWRRDQAWMATWHLDRPCLDWAVVSRQSLDWAVESIRGLDWVVVSWKDQEWVLVSGRSLEWLVRGVETRPELGCVGGWRTVLGRGVGTRLGTVVARGRWLAGSVNDRIGALIVLIRELMNKIRTNRIITPK